MVTVIPTPVHNGVTGVDSSDNQRLFQLIKDYQEVDFYRTSSCKPLPEDEQLAKPSINGTYLLQIDSIEPLFNQNQQNYDLLLLTLTDGIKTIQAIANEYIPNLNLNTKPGSKLLLNDIIYIKDGLLQLTHDNTKFQYGSNTYPRPRSAHRPRKYDGRRTNRYDNDDNETKLLKRPPPKNTLMDFMTSLKISNEKTEEPPQEQEQEPEQEQNGFDEQLDPEDDPSHVNYCERRNPLPPRLQRMQEERSRRNTNRYYDENDIQRGDPTSSHLPYFQTYSTYHNQQPFIASTYPNDHITFCYGAPYANPVYLPATVGNGFNGDTKNSTKISSDNENKDNEIKFQTLTENQDEKRRDTNPRPRWKIGDMCLARWSEDGEFYYANITDIHPPSCTVVFPDYNTYDQVHFKDLKPVPRDQQFYPFIPPSSDMNMLHPNAFYPPRATYYPDGCVMMPEAPPFPFNSDGTLYIYPPTMPSIVHTNGYQQEIQRNEYIDSSSSPSKDSNDTSGIDSTTISSNDDNQQQDISLPRPCSIADAPLTLVMSDELRERSASTESLTSNKSLKEEEEIRE